MPGRIDELEEFEFERDQRDLAFYPPSLPRRVSTPERELEKLFSIYRARQRRLDMEALRGGPAIDVSGYEQDFVGIKSQNEIRADELVDLTIAREQDAHKVARNIRRTERLLSEARGDRRWKYQFSTAWYPARRVNQTPRTVFGTEAWIRPFVNGRYASFASKGIALPCVERTTRRQVLFARNKARKGYRVKHRINALSHVWC